MATTSVEAKNNVCAEEYLVDHVKRIEVSIVCKIEHDF